MLRQRRVCGVEVVAQVSVTLRRENNLWCLRVASTGLYLCGFIDRANAVEQARREGWEIV